MNNDDLKNKILDIVNDNTIYNQITNNNFLIAKQIREQVKENVINFFIKQVKYKP